MEIFVVLQLLNVCVCENVAFLSRTNRAAMTNPDRLMDVDESDQVFQKVWGPFDGDYDVDVVDDENDVDGSVVDDPVVAANRDRLQHQRPRDQSAAALPWQRASAVESVEPFSGDRPGCPLIRDSFEAFQLCLFVREHHHFQRPPLSLALMMILLFFDSPAHKPMFPRWNNTWNFNINTL